MRRSRATRFVFPFLLASVCLFRARASGGEPPKAALLGRVSRLEQRAEQDWGLSEEVEQLQEEVHRLRRELTELGADHYTIEFTGFEEAFDDPVPLEGAATLGDPPEADPFSPPGEDYDQPLEPPAVGASGYGEGLDLAFWGWISYLYVPQRDRSTFWAWEAELDITKTFTDRLAGAADIDFTDTPFDEARPRIEQLFVSVVLPNKYETLIAAGKFNSPFGVEPRDFWDRLTGTTSLLFRAQPQDLTGLMVTQRLPESRVVLRPFVVNGFDHGLDVNKQPSIGVMAEYRLRQDVHLALTNWWGPEFHNENAETLYLLDAQLRWLVGTATTIAAEYLLGTGESPFGHVRWNGVLALVNYDCSETCRVFGRWSFLNDADGFVTGVAEDRHEVSAGVGYYLHPAVELRLEYRHDFRGRKQDQDELSAHVSFGY